MNPSGENQTSSPAPPRLTRSTGDKVVSGVCGGLGRHFGVDPVVFRIAFVVMALAGGSGVLLYLVAWLLVPDDHSGATVLDRARHGHSSQAMAAVFLAVGAVVVLDSLGDRKGGGRFGGLVLLGVGAAVLWSRRDRAKTLPSPTGPGSPPPPPPWAPPRPRHSRRLPPGQPRLPHRRRRRPRRPTGPSRFRRRRRWRRAMWRAGI
ncbi:MAG: PspC domain-containing protein [Actinomycetota bacterium]|nr:PspC domain-containing protein [Actinomycetota bacterium]